MVKKSILKLDTVSKNMKSTLQSPGQTLESKLKSILRSSPFTSLKELESISPVTPKPKKSDYEATPVQDASESLNEDKKPNQTAETPDNQPQTFVDEAQRLDDIHNETENNTPETEVKNQTAEVSNETSDQMPDVTHTVDDPEHSFSPLDKNGQRCSQVLMNMFKMQGLAKPETRVHPSCPNVTVSCCSEADDKRSLELWNSSLKPLVEVRYESVINSLKYLLGWGQEIYRIADELQGGFQGHKAGIFDDDSSQVFFVRKILDKIYIKFQQI